MKIHLKYLVISASSLLLSSLINTLPSQAFDANNHCAYTKNTKAVLLNLSTTGNSKAKLMNEAAAKNLNTTFKNKNLFTGKITYSELADYRNDARIEWISTCKNPDNSEFMCAFWATGGGSNYYYTIRCMYPLETEPEDEKEDTVEEKKVCTQLIPATLKCGNDNNRFSDFTNECSMQAAYTIEVPCP